MNNSFLCRFLVVATLLIVLTGSPLLAGVVFEVETTYHSGSPRGPESAQMSVEGKNLKMEILPGRDSSRKGKDEAIFRGDRRQMVVVDHHDKAYMVMDTATMSKMGGQVQGQMQQASKELEKHLAQLGPKQREIAEKMIKGGLGSVTGAAPPAVARSRSEYRRTSERATKQGYPCVKYEVLKDGEKTQELWVTDWGKVQGGQQAADAFEEMADFFKEMMDSISDTMGGGAGLFGENNPIESFTEIGGFPVVTRDFEGGELESETVLESVTERDLDPDAFEPPKGYRLRTMGPQ